MTKKQLLRCIAFLMVFCVMILALCELFDQENFNRHEQRYRRFRDLEKNTVDAIYVGTSGVDRYWVAAKAYEEYGMTVYPVSFDACAVWLIPDIIEDAMRYQDPQLILIDIRPFTQSCESANLVGIRGRRVIDSMEFFSPVRFRAAFRTAELVHEIDNTKSKWDISFLLPFVMQHSKWEQDYLVQVNVGNHKDPYLGFYMNQWLTIFSEEQNPETYSRDVTSPLDPITERCLYETLEYIREHDLDVLFVDSPKFYRDSEMPCTNTIRNILEEEGFTCLNFCSEEAGGSFTIDLDPKKDFYNMNHVNFYGAEKFTDALAAYLNEHYDLPDRRNDEAVKGDWDGIYDELLFEIREYERIMRDTPLEELVASLDLADEEQRAMAEELKARAQEQQEAS